MNYEFEFKKNQSNLPLSEILKIIDGENYDWRITNLCAVGKLSGEHTMLQLEKNVNLRVNGLNVSWDYIKRFSQEVDDIHDLKLFAMSKLFNKIDISFNILIIELFDSSFWYISTSDELLANKISKL